MKLGQNLAKILKTIAETVKKHGGATGSTKLLAVTKTRTIDEIRPLVNSGQLLLGENRPQEIFSKRPCLPENVQWHLIGPLQSNKVRRAVENAEVIQSVDRHSLIEKLGRVTEEMGVVQRIHLQVNAGRDPAKSGYEIEAAEEALELALTFPSLTVEGLMTIPPFTPHPEDARPHFAALRELRDNLKEKTGAALPELSMGMSHDFEAAIAEGSTMVRIGTALFGPRPPL